MPFQKGHKVNLGRPSANAYRGELCKIEDCGRLAKKRRMCGKHYLRWWKHGRTHLIRRENGLGTIAKNGYRVYGRHYKDVLEHREIWEKYYGPIPRGFHVHHKDHDRLNNDIKNLELQSHSEHSRYHSLERWKKWKEQRATRTD